eukprot:CAMPEP_0177763448 /NCGR_PEP_ID=MMETSP0491_2-20121128/6879_1 /TAXON_ID=63592 /ORGANISM="Tetraselmis chuii, Strain PLY429" /LENGTH=329 /DNA_ID=CAMNT_0019279561 /DNA_START=131 /DNA_END=1121 /DNA_ORIENTATION=+
MGRVFQVERQSGRPSVHPQTRAVSECSYQTYHPLPSIHFIGDSFVPFPDHQDSQARDSASIPPTPPAPILSARNLLQVSHSSTTSCVLFQMRVASLTLRFTLVEQDLQTAAASRVTYLAAACALATAALDTSTSDDQALLTRSLRFFRSELLSQPSADEATVSHSDEKQRPRHSNPTSEKTDKRTFYSYPREALLSLRTAVNSAGLTRDIIPDAILDSKSTNTHAADGAGEVDGGGERQAGASNVALSDGIVAKPSWGRRGDYGAASSGGAPPTGVDRMPPLRISYDRQQLLQLRSDADDDARGELRACLPGEILSAVSVSGGQYSRHK